MQQLLEKYTRCIMQSDIKARYIRDVALSKERDRVPYLIKEIKITLDKVQYRGKHMNESTLPLARRLKEM